MDRGEKFDAIIDALPAYIAVVDRHGLITSVNAAWRNLNIPSALVGAAVAPGKNYISVCRSIKGEQAADANAIAEGVEAVLRGARTAFAFEYALRPAIEHGWFEVTVSPFHAGNGGGAVIAHTNVTEQIRAEESIRVQLQILDNIGQAVIATDTQDEIIYANRFAGELYGWKPAEMVGRNAMAVTVPQASFSQASEIKERLARGKIWSGEFQVRNREGRVFPALVTYSPLLDREGQLVGVIGVSADITERKNLEKRFLRAQRMEGIGTLAGGIAHDLNNILAPVLMSVQMLRNWVKSDEGVDLIDTLEGNLRRGSDLVKQVLAFARGVEGDRAPVNLYYLANEIRSFVQTSFPKSVTLQLDVPQDIWAVMGDSTQLQQVLLNLCVNARDAMSDGGSLSISMDNVQLEYVNADTNPDSKPGMYVHIRVSDSGLGIAPVNREKIFEPFFTTKALGKGTGLGLSTALAIVKSHGGFINVQSMIGKGTTFDIYLPAMKGEARGGDHGAAKALSGLPRGRGETILVVDDEEAIRKIAQKLLEMYGYSVKLAAHGEEAVEIYRDQGENIDLVVTDMAMPIMDGPALIKRLKAQNPAVRIIGSSGLTSNVSVTHAAGEGVRHFVSKPYSANALLSTIRAALDE